MHGCPARSDSIDLVALADTYLAERESRAVPYETFSALRQAGPVLRTSSGTWLVSRYDEAKAVLADDESWSRRAAAEQHAVVEEGESREIYNSKLLTNDDPIHRRLRQLVAKAFSPASIRALEPRIRAICVELIEHAEPRGEMEAVTEYGYPVPEQVICDVLGVPGEDIEQFKKWAQFLIEVPPGGDIEAERANATSAVTEFRDYIRALVRRRSNDLNNDLLSRLIAAEEDGERLRETELVAIVFELITAGHETTARLIPNGLAHLYRDEHGLAALRENPTAIPAYVDEALRFESSAHMALPRVATRPVRVGGQMIPQGDTVIVLLGAANRDERRFERPGTFDPARSSNDHLAFGFGSHFCIGHTLAKTEARIATEELLTRLPTARLDEPEGLRWESGNMTRGACQLHLRW